MTRARAPFLLPPPLLAGLIALMLAVVLASGQAQAQDGPLRLAAPPEMVENGFLRHLLPRFKLKHRIAVAPVAPDAPADMVLSAEGEGVPVFAEAKEGGRRFRLRLVSRNPRTEKFLEWLTSPPGRAAIEGFPRGGPPLYTANVAEEVAEAAPEITGNAARGAELALVHCGRCHVIDERNRMAGIGSTPSFGALRALDDWHERFSSYYARNPHPSFTEILGVTPPFTEDRPTHVQPVTLSLEDVDDILAFVEALEPKFLGAPVRSAGPGAGE
ncbi:hypothetical protein SAMN05216257_10525 [Meinhardsimonia xiamenensis]|jgi:mono/diheme cytochrome c family protein|uniref:Cytochrome c domain-containing protein n=1 Tax=Meinhardsimonia xiamenensis TaxID=990712 RepID=A0A1G9F4A3_9RHOB|nr:hypothetical protein [Meinhardsimonia xiamenensis]PRX38004.1 hypothetical protein LV81_00277 [Meinhardsimonia xiamenensis]SDK83178.1 hypothetical protein SAMN05216257_10525 [Meinhardsimonia xiamenensis]